MIFRRIFAALALLCAAIAPAQAQKTKAALNAEIGVSFPDNVVGAITPQILRTVTGDIVNSIMPTAPVTPGDTACYTGTTGLLADCAAQTISVKAPPFNATGNGSTDDAAAIQAAANTACGTLGTGGAAQTLYFPAGFYRITTTISITCGLRVVGDGWSADSGALIQSQVISNNSGLSGSIIEPISTSAGLTFSTNQAVTIRDLAVVYLSRPAAASGTAGITIAASGAATPPAPLAWNIGSNIDHVWVYGADRDVVLANVGSFTVSNSLFQMHASNGILIQGPNLPFAGDWHIGPGNTFNSGSVTNCQHILIQSGGGGSIYNNKLNTCGSTNDVAPLSSIGIDWSPTLNVANNSLEPIVITGNTIEGVSQCIYFFGGNVGQNASATQINISGNQMWCLQDVVTSATSTNGMWISGMTIAGNFMTSQTQAAISTTTKNIDLDGVQNVNVTGNQFALVQGAGGDTSTAINVGAHTASIFQLSNKTLANVTMPSTVPLAADGTGTGIEAALRVNVGTAGAPVINGGALGTPSSGTGTNITNIPAPNLIGTIAAARMPALTGDCTTSVGTVAVICTQSAGDYKVTGFLQTGGDVRVTSQFDKTSSAVLADIPGLSVTLTSGLTYGFQANLYTSSNVASGVKASMAGTATATAVTFTGAYLASAGFSSYGRATALGGAIGGVTAVTDAEIIINGTITVNAGGTLTAQFAQNVSGGTASSVLIGSTLKVWKIQ